MVIKIDRKDVTEYTEKEVLFTLPAEVEGEPDREYSIFKKIAPARALRILKDVNERGEFLGSMLVLEEMLGKDGLNDLLNSPFVTDEDLAEISKACIERLTGQTEDAAPKE